MYEMWVDDVPRKQLDDGNVVLQWKKERTRKAELEHHRERARQNLISKWGVNSATTAGGIIRVDKCTTIEQLAEVCDGFWIAKTWIKKEEEKPVTINNALEIELLKKQIADLQKKAEKLEHGKWGREPANGGMFQIEKKFSSSITATKYKYLALKASGMWYLTGTGADGTRSYTWEGLKKFAGQYSRVWRLTVAEELLD